MALDKEASNRETRSGLKLKGFAKIAVDSLTCGWRARNPP